MNLIYKNPGLTYSIDSILEFQGEEQSEWWRESLFMFYPEINREKFDSLSRTLQAEYLTECLDRVYRKIEKEIEEKIVTYTKHWEIYRNQIQAALSDTFQLDVSNKFNHIVGNISLNPICPRYLDTTSFDVFYRNSEKGALGMALHEIIHFVWFDVWNNYFGDDANDYETPHLKWVLSEMVVDPIMRKDERLHRINPYFNDGCVYEYFYSMKIDGKPILETLYGMYDKTDIHSFMEQSYAYCKKHEEDIRKQMQ